MAEIYPGRRSQMNLLPDEIDEKDRAGSAANDEQS